MELALLLICFQFYLILPCVLRILIIAFRDIAITAILGLLQRLSLKHPQTSLTPEVNEENILRYSQDDHLRGDMENLRVFLLI